MRISILALLSPVAALHPAHNQATSSSSSNSSSTSTAPSASTTLLTLYGLGNGRGTFSASVVAADSISSTYALTCQPGLYSTTSVPNCPPNTFTLSASGSAWGYVNTYSTSANGTVAIVTESASASPTSGGSAFAYDFGQEGGPGGPLMFVGVVDGSALAKVTVSVTAGLASLNEASTVVRTETSSSVSTAVSGLGPGTSASTGTVRTTSAASSTSVAASGAAATAVRADGFLMWIGMGALAGACGALAVLL